MILTQLLAATFIALLRHQRVISFPARPAYPGRHRLDQANRAGEAAAVLSVINASSLLLPPYFLFGIVSGLARNAGDHQLFLLGMYSTKGWWYYFPSRLR